MPNYFKKRRAQGPSKNEQKVMRAKDAENQARSAGILGEKFPSVRQLNIRLVFTDSKQHVIDEKTLSFGPSEACLFTIPCPGRCGAGSFNFAGKVQDTVLAALAVSEASGKCSEPLYAGSPEACGCQAKCQLEIDYFPVEKPLTSG